MPEFHARYEFKYLIDESEQSWIREMATAFCDPDPYGDGGVYRVCSLYFDTWDWRLALQTVEGIRSRMKLRIRCYDFEDGPVFVENKSRVGTTILKSRAQIPREHFRMLCQSEPPPEGGYLAAKPSHQKDYDGFRNVMDVLDLRPRVWVNYQREAYGSRFGDGARLTFDRLLEVQAPDLLEPERPDPAAFQRVQLDGKPIILELKFNNAFPGWMRNLVHRLGLRRVSCSKYVQGAEQLGDLPWNRVEWRGAWTVY